MNINIIINPRQKRKLLKSYLLPNMLDQLSLSNMYLDSLTNYG